MGSGTFKFDIDEVDDGCHIFCTLDVVMLRLINRKSQILHMW